MKTVSQYVSGFKETGGGGGLQVAADLVAFVMVEEDILYISLGIIFLSGRKFIGLVAILGEKWRDDDDVEVDELTVLVVGKM